MYANEPAAEQVDDVMESVRISDAVCCRKYSETEQCDASDMTDPACGAGNHSSGGEGLDEEDVRHDGKDVVV